MPTVMLGYSILGIGLNGYQNRIIRLYLKYHDMISYPVSWLGSKYPRLTHCTPRLASGSDYIFNKFISYRPIIIDERVNE